MKQTRWTLLIFILTFFLMNSCDEPGDNLNNPGNGSIYILCEGNYGQANASLWNLDESMELLSGPIHWTTGPESENPLGDVGQSVRIFNDFLYIVINNSHTVEIMDLSNGEAKYVKTIELPSASPRDILVENKIAYISSWGLNAIISYDLENGTFLDTINLGEGRQPENLLFHNDLMYVSIKQYSDWSAGHEVIEYSLNNGFPAILRTFGVIDGPGTMLIDDDELLVAGNSYNINWENIVGTSKINLTSGNVISTVYPVSSIGTSDLLEFDGTIYRTYNKGLYPLFEDMTFDTVNIIGDYDNIYSASGVSDYFIITTTDYQLDNKLIVLDKSGEEVNRFQIGALPGSIAY